MPIGEEGEDDLVKTWGEELFESRKGAEDHLDFAKQKVGLILNVVQRLRELNSIS